jgi:hypothetical protein
MSSNKYKNIDRTGPAIWNFKYYDIPIEITGLMGIGKDGRAYMRDKSGTGIPLDEITWLDEEEKEG